jgi:hypothetical protein
LVIRPDWSLGKGAGLAANKEMARLADKLVAIHDGKSKGKAHWGLRYASSASRWVINGWTAPRPERSGRPGKAGPHPSQVLWLLSRGIPPRPKRWDWARMDRRTVTLGGSGSRSLRMIHRIPGAVRLDELVSRPDLN